MSFKERSGKEKSIIISRWVLQVLMGLAFIVAGAPKLFINHEMWVSRFEGWGYPGNFHYVVGLLELGGALLLFFPRYVLYASGMLAVIMVGATGTVVLNDESAASPAVFLALLLALFYLSFLSKSIQTTIEADAVD